ncbi:MAG TPA: peptidylprolyl isomerase [Prolixibacteraceae bacterium]|nr:peptidylprolyl isomerase [Prolixibacteraceae bacterium]
MRKFVFFIATALLAIGVSCGNNKKGDDEKLVLIQTNYGDIQVKLYDKTEEHTNNFIKLANEGFYDSLLFHRVIENFMIQGGDPDSKNAESTKKLGEGALDYSLQPEFFPEYFHKRGALAAARRSDMINPQKRSSASQFYIIQGEKYTAGQLDTLLMVKNEGLKKRIFNLEIEKNSRELDKLSKIKDQEKFKELLVEIRLRTDTLYEEAKKYEITDEQREAYTTIGGYPSLDGDYTVFGEVVKGMEVVDKIAAVETGAANRPVKDVIILNMEVLD